METLRFRSWPALGLVGLVGLVGATTAAPAVRPVGTSAASPPPQPFALVPSPACPRRLSAGGDVYEIDLPADSYLHATFDQLGTDIAVTVSAPGSRRLWSVDSPNGSHGPEEIHLVSGEAGRYRFEVTGPPGDYCPRLQEVRPPSPQDRQQAAADQDLYTYTDKELTAAEQEERLRRAIPRFEEVGDRWHQAAALYRLADLLLGDRPQKAIDPLSQAEALLEAEGDRHLLLAIRIEKGQLYSARFDFDHAQKSLEDALDLARETGEVEKQATALHELGLLFEARGETWQALRDFRDAILLWRRIHGSDAREQEANSLTGRGWVYASTGAWKRALEDHQSALRLRNRFSSLNERARSALQIASVLLHTDPPRALLYVNKAWQLLEKDRSKSVALDHDRAATLNGLGRALDELGHLASGRERKARYREARKRFAEALDLYSAAPQDRFGQAITWLHLGTTAFDLGAWEEADRSFGQALDIGREAANLKVQVQALLGQAEVELLRHHLTAAREQAEKALDLCESLRAGAVRTDLQTSYLAANVNVYHLLISILMAEQRQQPRGGYGREAFERSEQTRARSLLDALRASSQLRLDRQAGVPPSLLNRFQTLLGEIDTLSRQRDQPGSDPVALDRRLSERMEVLNELNVEIQKSGGPASPAPPSFSFEQARKLLDPDTLLLEYSLGKQSYLWAVSAAGVRSFHLPGRDTLEPLLRAVAEKLHTDEGPTDDTLHQLSELLLGPVAGQLHGKRLLIAADGGAQYLPFAVLPDPGAPPGRSRPLLVDHEIDYVPSLAVLAELRARRSERSPAPLPLAILADPVFDQWDKRLPRGPKIAEEEPILQRLPQSRTEAEVIAALLPPGQVFSKLGLDASRDLVMNGSLGRYRILHFATHGILNTEYPELSALVFSRFDAQRRPRDGFLRVSDLQHLDLPADLVVLSACNTALGRETPGEGLVGLPQAFLTAGASSVLVSLWAAVDSSTAALMSRFYHGVLLEHLPPGRALREAQLAVRSDPRWGAPRYWAAFVLQGDWRDGR